MEIEGGYVEGEDEEYDEEGERAWAALCWLAGVGASLGLRAGPAAFGCPISLVVAGLIG